MFLRPDGRLTLSRHLKSGYPKSKTGRQPDGEDVPKKSKKERYNTEMLAESFETEAWIHQAIC